jgi:DNA-binding NarL/FixJ family response regulator
MSRARVLVAEDHPRVAEELRRLLEREFEVIAVVEDAGI